MNNHTVITISRQYGSGGRELANKIAEKLGYKLFDRQIVHLAAAQIGIDDLSEHNLRNLENNVTPLSLSFIPFFNFGSRNTGFNNDIFICNEYFISKVRRLIPKCFNNNETCTISININCWINIW